METGQGCTVWPAIEYERREPAVLHCGPTHSPDLVHSSVLRQPPVCAPTTPKDPARYDMRGRMPNSQKQQQRLPCPTRVLYSSPTLH